MKCLLLVVRVKKKLFHIHIPHLVEFYQLFEGEEMKHIYAVYWLQQHKINH